MRKGTIRVWESHGCSRSNRKQKSIWTDGYRIYSYNTVILWLDPDKDIKIQVNVNRYSRTTSTHQNGLIRLLTDNGYRFETVETY